MSYKFISTLELAFKVIALHVTRMAEDCCPPAYDHKRISSVVSSVPS